MKHAPHACPTCGHVMDNVDSISEPDQTPKPGDLSLCIRCGEVLVFNPDLTVRAALLNDLMEASPDARALIGRTQTLIRSIRR